MHEIILFIKNNTEVSVAIIVIISGSLGFLIKSWFDKKVKLKIALHILLEVWNQVIIFRRLNSIDISLVLRSIMSEIFPGVDIDKEVPVEARVALYQNIAKMIASEDASQNISKLKSEFQNAIYGIASYDPILAYKTNNIDILDMLNGADTYYSNIRELISGVCSNELIEDISTMGKQFGFDEVLTDLEKDIGSLAWEISPFTGWKVRRIIQKRARNVSLDGKETQELVDKAKIAISNLMSKEAARSQNPQ